MSIIGVIGQQVAVQVDFALRNRPPIVARGLETAYQNDIVVELADRAVVDVFGLAPAAQVVVIVAFADELRAAFVADDGAQFLLILAGEFERRLGCESCLRFGRLATPIINDNAEYKFEIGKGVTLREGTDVAIIATGLCVAESLAAAEKLAADGVNAKVINIHTIKPLDEELVVAAAKECGRVVTVEEHSVIGGLGAAVCETLSRKAPTPVKTIGIQDCFGESGPAVALLKKYGLDAEGIYASVKDFL